MSRDVSLPQAEANSGCRVDSALWLAFRDNNPEAAASPRGSSCSLLLLQSTCTDTMLSIWEAMGLAATRCTVAAGRQCCQVSWQDSSSKSEIQGSDPHYGRRAQRAELAALLVRRKVAAFVSVHVMWIETHVLKPLLVHPKAVWKGAQGIALTQKLDQVWQSGNFFWQARQPRATHIQQFQLL